MTIVTIGELKLSPGDEVVACTYYRDFVIVITRHGCVYRLDLRNL